MDDDFQPIRLDTSGSLLVSVDLTALKQACDELQATLEDVSMTLRMCQLERPWQTVLLDMLLLRVC